MSQNARVPSASRLSIAGSLGLYSPIFLFLFGALACGTSAAPGGGTGSFGGGAGQGDTGLIGGQDGAGGGMDAQAGSSDVLGDVGSGAVDAGNSDGAAGSIDVGAGSTDAGGAIDAGEQQDGGAAGADVPTADIQGPGCAVKCTWEEVCEAGKCVKVSKPCNGQCGSGQYCDVSSGQCLNSACTLPLTWGPSVQKISEFMIAATSQGCDLDGDKSPDNNLGNLLKFYPDANVELYKSIQSGEFVMLFEAPMYGTGGTAFSITALVGDLDSSNYSCSPTSDTANCKYKVDDENYASAASGTCPPQVVFKPATAKNNQLVAGGKGQNFTITLPIMSGLQLSMGQATMDGQTTGMSVWQTTTSGRICGVMTEHDLLIAIDAVPAEGWGQIGLTKEQVKKLVPLVLKPDIDTNGDGVFDALSVALLFKSVPGQISGIQY